LEEVDTTNFRKPYGHVYVEASGVENLGHAI